MNSVVGIHILVSGQLHVPDGGCGLRALGPRSKLDTYSDPVIGLKVIFQTLKYTNTQ